MTGSWDHVTGTFNICTELSFVNNVDKKTRKVTVTIKGFNQYGIHDGDHNEDGIIKQEKILFHLIRISYQG